MEVTHSQRQRDGVAAGSHEYLEDNMSSIKSTARLAGILYFLMAVLRILKTFYFSPAFIVPGDVAATALNITNGEQLYRLGILVGFIALILFLFLAWTLYELFKDVDKKQARLMLILVTVGIGMALVNMINGFAPLIFLSGADFLSVFTKPQLDALALGFLKLRSSGTLVVTVFWGLWLIPFGILVYKSDFLPKVLGVLLILAGIAHPIQSFTSIVLPAHAQIVSKILMPLQFGELPIIFWLLIKGAKVPPNQALKLTE
jgi:uncharacterized membrane protein YwzB